MTRGAGGPRIRRLRRFIVLCLALWLVTSILRGDTGAGWLVLSGGLCILVTLLVVDVLRRYRYVYLSMLVAFCLVTIGQGPLFAMLGRALPDSTEITRLGLALAVTVALSRVVAGIGWLADRILPRGNWEERGSVLVPLTRAEVWDALALGTAGPHWNPDVAQILRDPRDPRRFDVIFRSPARTVRRLALVEIARDEGVVQTLDTDPALSLGAGGASVRRFTLRLIPHGRGTVVEIVQALRDQPVRARIRLWLEAEVADYTRAFRRHMRRGRPRRARRFLFPLF